MINDSGFPSRTRLLYEDEREESPIDPEETTIPNRRLITQPYDLVVSSLFDQINSNIIHLRPVSDRPQFQRLYVWTNKLASKLIESILLNVPIPPCYLSQDEEFKLDVIDGQQRIYSIYRFLDNQFKLKDLEVASEYNDLRFHELPLKEQRKLKSHTLRCVIITNESHPEIRFDVFQRLNSNTMPLNAQELRNCIYRGSLMDLVNKLSGSPLWLKVLKRKEPDHRMRGAELVLRFFAFQIAGISSYRTPQKHWLNDVVKAGRKYPPAKINELEKLWTSTVERCLQIFKPEECFRRLPLGEKSKVINRALMDLTMFTIAKIPSAHIPQLRNMFRKGYKQILKDKEFLDLITRAMDHKKRTKRRFELWHEKVEKGLI